MKSLKEAEEEPFILSVTCPHDAASSAHRLCVHCCPSIRQMHCSTSFFRQLFGYIGTRGRYPTSQIISHITANTSDTSGMSRWWSRCWHVHSQAEHRRERRCRKRQRVIKFWWRWTAVPSVRGNPWYRELLRKCRAKYKWVYFQLFIASKV